MAIAPLVRYVYRAHYLLEKRTKNDGDTWWLDVDLGLRQHSFTKIRLHGFYAPEMSTPEGVLAARTADALLAGATQIVVETYKTIQGVDYASHDRWVADVWVDGVPMSAALKPHLQRMTLRDVY